MLSIDNNAQGTCVVSFRDLRAELVETVPTPTTAVRFHNLLCKAGVPHRFQNVEYPGSTWDLVFMDDANVLTCSPCDPEVLNFKTEAMEFKSYEAALPCIFHSVGEYI